MTRRRSLRPDEEALWHSVARTTTPMHKAGGFRAAIENLPESSLTPPKMPEKQVLKPFQIGSRSRGTTAAPAMPLAQPIQMDAKAYARMTRGKLRPEARLDLHGMTLDEAHSEMIRFILNASSKGLRLVLVITGKGKPGADDGPIPRRSGVLRQQLPHWLRQPPLSLAILQVSQAHLRHGGSGAYYVYLRRRG